MINSKKILIFGLGRHGGGIATAKWWAKKNVKLRITDLLSKKELGNSLNQLKNIKASYIFEQNRKQDIDWADVVVVNPGVSYKNPLVKYAKKINKIVENDCSLFFKLAKCDIIAITGTKGKTTTSVWTHHIIRRFTQATLGGNQPDKALLKIISKTKKNSCAIVELSSFQLEFYPNNITAPKIALITNLYTDHLNRYDSLEEYASAKAKIFQNQTANDYLLLNYSDNWTFFFLKQKPKSKIYFFSIESLPKTANGISIKNDEIYFQENGASIKLFSIKQFRQQWGEHNVQNLLASLLASYLFVREKKLLNNSKIIKNLETSINSLPQIQFRQEIIFQNEQIKIINDSAGTIPDATIQALRRFAPQGTSRFVRGKPYTNQNKLVLITGGTDKNLDFKDLAKEIKNTLSAEQVIFLNGSATQKLLKELKKIKFDYFKKNAENDTSSLAIFENLRGCIKKATKIYPVSLPASDCQRRSERAVNISPRIVLFSPGAASFEKFKNEFDRGKKFNQFIKKNLIK